MNCLIIESLELLSKLSKVVVQPFEEPNWYKLYAQKKVFHNLCTGEITEEFPERASFIDSEWLCMKDGLVEFAGQSVTRTKPFSLQFIGLSGQTYLWFGDRNTLCSVGPKLILGVAHNAEAERKQIQECHQFNSNLPPFFFCTMSAHRLVAGISGQQEWQYVPGQTNRRAGGMANLVDVYNFWGVDTYPEVMSRYGNRGTCPIESKDIREVFYRGDIREIEQRIPELMRYGIEDVNKMVAILKTLYSAWLDHLPMKESQYFYLKRGKVNYSLAPDFNEWVKSTEDIYQSVLSEIEIKVTELINDIVNHYTADIDRVVGNYNIDIASNCKKLCTKGSGYTKLLKKYENEYNLHLLLNPKIKVAIEKYSILYPSIDWSLQPNGKPLWYTKGTISSKSINFQLLLEPKYLEAVDSYAAIYYRRDIGFYYNAADNKIQKVTSPKKGVMTKDNCGSLFSKDFIEYWESGVLTCDNSIAQEIVKLMAQVTYWTSIRSRIFEIAVRD